MQQADGCDASLTYRQVCLLGAPLPVQLPTNASGKEAEDDPGTWVPATSWVHWMEFQTPGFAFTQPQSMHPIGKLTNTWKILFPLSLSLPLPSSAMQVNKLLKKNTKDWGRKLVNKPFLSPNEQQNNNNKDSKQGNGRKTDSKYKKLTAPNPQWVREMSKGQTMVKNCRQKGKDLEQTHVQKISWE